MAQTIDFSRFRRTTEENGHTHLVYIKVDGSAETSFNDTHRHIVESRIVAPEAPGEVEDERNTELVLVGANGHTHKMIPFEPKGTELKSDMTDDEIVLHVFNTFEQNQLDERESRIMAEESTDMVNNKQWDEADRSQLEQDSRPALTLNKMISRVNAMRGQLIATRTETRWFPVESSDAFGADVFNMMVKDVNRRSIYESEEDDVFGTQLSYGRGLFQYSIDRSRPEGDVIIRAADPNNVFFSKHKRRDATDAKSMIKTEMLSRGDAKDMFPKKADEIEEAFELTLKAKELKQDPSIMNIQLEPDRSIFSGRMVGHLEIFDTDRGRIRVIELQERIPKRIKFLRNENEGIRNELFGFTPQDVKDVATIQGFDVSEVLRSKIKITRTVGNVLISQIQARVFEDFDIVPVYAYKHVDGWMSWVEPVKDLQREINKRRSVQADIMNRMNAWGYFTTAEMFRNDGDATRFANDSAKTGWTFELNNINERPVVQQGIPLPVALVQSIAIDGQSFDDVLNTPPAVLGQPGTLESGIAFQLSRRQGLSGNQFLFGNLSISKKILYTNVTRVLQKISTPQKVLRLIRAQPKGLKLGDQEPEKMDDTLLLSEISRVLGEADLTDYDMALSEIQSTPTNRNTTFLELARLKQLGVAVPDEMTVEFLDTLPLAQKQILQEQIVQQRQAAAEAQERKSKSEVNKALIGQGIIPRELQAEISGAEQVDGGGQPSTPQLPQGPPVI